MGLTAMPKSPDAARLLRFLRAGNASVMDAGQKGLMLLDGGSRGTIAVKRTLLAKAISSGLVAVDAERNCRLNDSSQSKQEAVADALAVSAREPVAATIAGPQGPDKVTINLAESPLSLLASRRDRNGRRFLSADECAAGERLRRDYERACLMPRLGINWERPIVGSHHAGIGDGQLDFPEAVLAARIRVEKAIETVGPELAGILVDICCFLKGLQQVEAERGWPARSAKIMLKSALAALDRHYRPQHARVRRAFHWGAPGFRPTMAGPETS